MQGREEKMKVQILKFHRYPLAKLEAQICDSRPVQTVILEGEGTDEGF